MVLLSLLRPGGRKNRTRKRPQGQAPPGEPGEQQAGSAPPELPLQDDGGVLSSLLTLLVILGGLAFFGPKIYEDYVRGPPPKEGECRLRDHQIGWVFTQYDFGDCTVVRTGAKDKRLGNAGAVAEALKVNTVLLNLELKTNMIGPLGATALAEALKVNTDLETLGLASNWITDPGVRDLVEALKVRRACVTVAVNRRGVYSLLVEAL